MIRLCLGSVSFCSNKSSRIFFGLKVPPSHLHEPSNKESNSRMIKLKRKDLSQYGLNPTEPAYESDQDFKSQNQKAYDHVVQTKEDSNLATHRYYQHQLQRGEDLIDDVPIDPYYEYRVQDLRQSVKEREIEYQKYFNIHKLVRPNKLANLKKILEGYEESKHRYELEEFEKYLANYPGGLNGQEPEQDPEAYAQYAVRGMPSWLKAEVQQEQGSLKQDGEDESSGHPLDIGYISDMVGQDRNFRAPKDQDDNSQLITEAIHKDFDEGLPFLVPYSEIPYLPQVQYEQFHSHMAKLTLWGKFRDYYEYRMLIKKQQKLANLLQKQYEQQVERRGTDAWTIPHKAYSLYLYYKTLPKEIQENSAVRTCYLGLEYSQPDESYEAKEEALNKAAMMSLPLDKFSQAAMQELIQKRRYYLTPQLVDRIFNIHPEFTWDIHQFLNEVKDEKLRSMSTVKEKEEHFIEPPQVHLQWEQGYGNLPVDYYDNEDGFWDDHLEQKLNRYQKVQPLLKKSKKYFIH